MAEPGSATLLRSIPACRPVYPGGSWLQASVEHHTQSMIALDVIQQDGTSFPVVDYASAGKTWTEESKMCAWMKTEKANID